MTQDSLVITWDDLRPDEVTDFDDPYADLTPRQLLDLSELSRIKWGPEELRQPDDVAKAEQLRQNLSEAGLDVDWLLSQIERVANHYTQQAMDTSPTLEGQLVKLVGYVLPLEHNAAQQVSRFLLVPYIGACVHVPPPLPNQIIYVEPPAAIDDPGLFAKVWLEGTIRQQASEHSFFRVDGEQHVEVSYAMEDGAIAPFHLQLADQPNGFLAQFHSAFWSRIQAGLDAELPPDHSWWQRLQIRTSTIFTQTMTDIGLRRSWAALSLGLVIAFGYGVLHTLGPGHGKAVIVSYFVGEGGSLRRGITMGVRIAVFHVISAIVVVVVADVLLRQTIGSSPANYRIVRLVSYASIALIGGLMLRQAMRSLPTSPSQLSTVRLRSRQSHPLSTVRLRSRQSHLPSTIHHQPLTINVQQANSLLYPRLTEHVLATGDRPSINRTTAQGVINPPRSTNPQHTTGFCNCFTCGTAPSGGWLSLAVGAVPCSGALLVLLYGLANDLLWPSVLMAIAISCGMAVTLSLIGMMTIWGRNMSDRRINPDSRRHQRVAYVARIVGASAVFFIGLFLFGFTLASGLIA